MIDDGVLYVEGLVGFAGMGRMWWLAKSCGDWDYVHVVCCARRGRNSFTIALSASSGGLVLGLSNASALPGASLRVQQSQQQDELRIWLRIVKGFLPVRTHGSC